MVNALGIVCDRGAGRAQSDRCAIAGGVAAYELGEPLRDVGKVGAGVTAPASLRPGEPSRGR